MLGVLSTVVHHDLYAAICLTTDLEGMCPRPKEVLVGGSLVKAGLGPLYLQTIYLIWMLQKFWNTYLIFAFFELFVGCLKCTDGLT